MQKSACEYLEITIIQSSITNNYHFRKTTKSLHTTGCHEAMGEFLRGKMGVLGGVAAAVALLQITIISGASVLIKKWDVP